MQGERKGLCKESAQCCLKARPATAMVRELLLVDLLIYMQGPKLACGEGGCGACAVLVERKDAVTGAASEQLRVERLLACIACFELHSHRNVTFSYSQAPLLSRPSIPAWPQSLLYTVRPSPPAKDWATPSVATTLSKVHKQWSSKSATPDKKLPVGCMPDRWPSSVVHCMPLLYDPDSRLGIMLLPT